MCISTLQVKKRNLTVRKLKPKIEVHSAKWLAWSLKKSQCREKKKGGLENCFILKGLSRHEN